MIDNSSIYDFNREVVCSFRDERYSIRDNGAILRHARDGQRLRPNDNQWTFGNHNGAGYLDLTSVPVHRIIATGFHGAPPTEWHVVDHVDANKINNRPENLRWVSKWENILLDPITAKRVARLCGSVEAFLNNPRKYQGKLQSPKLEWIGTISMEEAQITLNSLLALAEIDENPSRGALDRWLVNRLIWENPYFEEEPAIPDIRSITENAIQRNWITRSEFAYCPLEHNGEPIQAYANLLETGMVFCRNENYILTVSKSAISDDQQSLYVISERKHNKPWALAKITYEENLFVHTSLGSFYTREGCEKQFTLDQGLEWFGGYNFDDDC